LQEINNFDQQRINCIKLVKSESKDMYNVTNKCCPFELPIHQMTLNKVSQLPQRILTIRSAY